MEIAKNLAVAEIVPEGQRAADHPSSLACVPYLSLLGIDIEMTPAGAVLRMKCGPTLLGRGGLHGGALSALMESAASFALLQGSEPAGRPRLISFTAEYLRPGRPRDTFADALIVRRGRRVANLQVQAWQDERSLLVATAQASFLLERSGDASHL